MSRSMFPLVLLLSAAISGGCRSSAAAPAGVKEAFGLHWTTIGGMWEVSPDALVGSGGWLMTTEQFGDATIELDAELLGGVGGRTLGVGFRYQPVTDITKASGYGVNLTTGASTYNVFKGTSGSWMPTNPAFTSFQPSPSVQPKRNHIEIRSAGKSHTIKVNGQQIARFEDETYATGAVNLWVESSGEKVKFTNVRVTR